MVTQEDLDNQLRTNLYAMQEGDTYQVSQTALSKINKVRAQFNYSEIENFFFKREKNTLFYKWNLEDLWKRIEKFDISQENLSLAFAFSSTFTLPFALGGLTLTLALAFNNNALEKLQNDSCAGKIVEIDGKKYKLQLV